MKGIMLLADCFEDIEALGTLDLLRRAKIDIETISITNNKIVKSQSNVIIQADKLLTEINLDDYTFLIIPGGKAVMKTHLDSEITKMVVDLFIKKNALIATICAAPSILGKEGYLNDCEYVCYPSFEKLVTGGKYLEKQKVVVDNNIITSKAAGTIFEFVYEIIKYLKSEAIAKHIMETVFFINN